MKQKKGDNHYDIVKNPIEKLSTMIMFRPRLR